MTPFEPAALAKAIIDAIPGALGITPDPWPEEPDARDGEPHRTVAHLIDSALKGRCFSYYGGLGGMCQHCGASEPVHLGWRAVADRQALSGASDSDHRGVAPE